MKVLEFNVIPCKREEIKEFIERWHYSKSINGIMSNYCFKLMNGEKMIGAMIYGKLAMANAWKKYGKKEDDVIELRRLCCIDDTPKNTESYFIGRTLRWLKQNTDIKIVVSYADPEYGHSGIIYKASNFSLIGQSSKGRVIMWNGKKYHDKAIRTKYKGELKPFAQKIKQALDSKEAFYKKTCGKNIYIYYLTPPNKSLTTMRDAWECV
jgi:hypothetical protein